MSKRDESKLKAVEIGRSGELVMYQVTLGDGSTHRMTISHVEAKMENGLQTALEKKMEWLDGERLIRAERDGDKDTNEGEGR